MSRLNFILGGYMGEDDETPNDDLIVKNVVPVPSGIYSISEQTILSYASSWPRYSEGLGAGVYVTSSQTVNMANEIIGFTGDYAYVMVAGGAGSGASDDDCQGQGPGGRGGFGKALVNIASKGNSAVFVIGNGGASVRGNDATGASGNTSTCTIGNFVITANGGGGGNSKNGGGAAGNVGNSNSSNADSFSSSNVFYSPLVETVDGVQFTYQNAQTSVNGGGGGCGGASGAGQNGFGYIRFGSGINSGTTLTPGNDGTAAVAYTPFY